MSKEDIIAAIDEAAFKYGLSSRFLTALVETESDYNPNAKRLEKDYRWFYSVKEVAEEMRVTKETVIEIQRYSYGLTQLMGANFHALGYRGLPSKMFDVRINLNYGCIFIERIIKTQHLKNPLDIYAAYNAGSVRKNPSGLYVNQKHVDRFKGIYERISLTV